MPKRKACDVSFKLRAVECAQKVAKKAGLSEFEVILLLTIEQVVIQTGPVLNPGPIYKSHLKKKLWGRK